MTAEIHHEDSRQARHAFFDQQELLDHTTGYWERPVAWFKEHILPDFLATKERLGLVSPLIDVGCAQGYFTALYAEYFRVAYGIDFSAARIAKAQQRTGNLAFAVIDLLDGPLWKHQSCGSAISSAVFQHIAPQDRVTAFSTVRSMLKPGSWLILYDSNAPGHPWDGMFQPLSQEWIEEHLNGIFTLHACEYICETLQGEKIFRYELQAVL